MKKRTGVMGFIMALCFLFPVSAHAEMGDMGYFGGISEGTRLPKTTETILAASKTSTQKTTQKDLAYKETVFLDGNPVVFEGVLRVKTSAIPAATVGTFTESYQVLPSASTSPDVSINRNITLTVNYRKEGTQIIKDSEMKTWTETIAVRGTTYTLDKSQSHYGVSIIEDITPGVTYYKGNVSEKAVYTGGTGSNKRVLETSGSIYGYNSAWSSTETHRIDAQLYASGDATWQMQYQMRPSVSVSKKLQYSKNEPTAISFDGNYYEVMNNQSGMEYNINVLPAQFSLTTPKEGKMTISSNNAFEQLVAPDTAFLKGNFAEQDIKKLFSMQILSGDPKFYKPNQAITRGQYVMALAKAIKLPVELPTAKTTSGSKKAPINIIFPDVQPDREEYPYINASYKAGLAVGRDNGQFYVDSPIERQEAVVILMRALGLANLGLDPTPVTTFTDDDKVAAWAKREVYAANRIGIISGDQNGNFRPKDNISKAEAAAFMNRMLTYMREDLQIDYTEHIVPYAN